MLIASPPERADDIDLFDWHRKEWAPSHEHLFQKVHQTCDQHLLDLVVLYTNKVVGRMTADLDNPMLSPDTLDLVLAVIDGANGLLQRAQDRSRFLKEHVPAKRSPAERYGTAATDSLEQDLGGLCASLDTLSWAVKNADHLGESPERLEGTLSEVFLERKLVDRMIRERRELERAVQEWSVYTLPVVPEWAPETPDMAGSELPLRETVLFVDDAVPLTVIPRDLLQRVSEACHRSPCTLLPCGFRVQPIGLASLSWTRRIGMLDGQISRIYPDMDQKEKRVGCELFFHRKAALSCMLFLDKDLLQGPEVCWDPSGNVILHRTWNKGSILSICEKCSLFQR